MRPWIRALTLSALLLGLSGCKLAVFERPVTLSTRSLAVAQAEPLGRVTVERCNYQVLIIPVIRDPKPAYEELLSKAQEMGGNTVIDFEVRGAGLVGVLPIFMRACWEVTGIAARL